MTNLKQRPISAAIGSSASGVQASIMAVTPETAEKWIANAESAGFENRAASAAVISKYANEMATGRWNEGTYDPIHLAVENGLAFPINGQHRLKALLAANMTINFLVVVGVDRSVFKYYDQGRLRDLPQIIAIANKESGGKEWLYPQPQATTARLLYKEDATGNPTIRPDADDQDQDGVIFDKTCERYGNMLDAVYRQYNALLTKIQNGERVPGQSSKPKGLGPKGIWAYFALRAKDWGKGKQAELNNDRLYALLSYAAAPSQTSSPKPAFKSLVCYISAIREISEGDEGRVMKGRHKEFSDLVTAALFVAWNADVTGKKLAPITSIAARTKSGGYAKWFNGFDALVDAQLSLKKPNGWVLSR